jgi:hypothetical protein
MASVCRRGNLIFEKRKGKQLKEGSLLYKITIGFYQTCKRTKSQVPKYYHLIDVVCGQLQFDAL